MKLDDFMDALNGVKDRFVNSAGDMRPRRRWYIPAIAAALVIAVGIGVFAHVRDSGPTSLPVPAGVDCLAEGEYPKRVAYTKDTVDQWRDQRDELGLTDAERAALVPYLESSVPAFLSGREGENAVCSPMDLYIALSMLAETTGGSSQRQILDLLGSGGIQDQRALTDRVWNALYIRDGVTELDLASSLWLRDDMTYSKRTMDRLGETYHASAYSGEMGGPALNKMFHDWMNAHTGGKLTDEIGTIEFTRDTAMALAATLYFKDKWYFDESLTEQGAFHAPQGDEDVMYMHGFINQTRYYWNDRFSAVYRSMERSTVLLLLPDEGVTPEELLSDPAAMGMMWFHRDQDKSGIYDIKLTLPRFDIRSDGIINGTLMDLGVTDVFDPNTADFTPAGAVRSDGTDAELYLNRAFHGVRVTVDEEGCEGAAYTVFEMGDGQAGPPEDVKEIEMVFDRPFIFAVIISGLPVFAGIVNHP